MSKWASAGKLDTIRIGKRMMCFPAEGIRKQILATFPRATADKLIPLLETYVADNNAVTEKQVRNARRKD